METAAEATFKDLLNIQGTFQFDQESLFAMCQRDMIKALETHMASFDHAKMLKQQEKFDIKQRTAPVDVELIDTLYQIINDHVTHYYIEYEDRGQSGNVLTWVHNIIRETILRLPPQGKEPEIPSPLGNIKVTRKELEKQGFGTILSFLDKVRDRKLLEKIFDQRMYERYHRIGFWNRDAQGKTTFMNPRLVAYKKKLLDIIMNELAIDMVRGKVLFSGECMMYVTRKEGPVYRYDKEAKKHVIEKYWGPGVYVGELVLQELADNESNPILAKNGRTSNLEYFAEVLIEETQHVLAPSAQSHGLLEKKPDGSTNFNTVVEHAPKLAGTKEFMFAIEKKHHIEDGIIVDAITKKIWAEQDKRKEELKKQSSGSARGFNRHDEKPDWSDLIKDITPKINALDERTRLNEAIAQLK